MVTRTRLSARLYVLCLSCFISRTKTVPHLLKKARSNQGSPIKSLWVGPKRWNAFLRSPAGRENHDFRSQVETATVPSTIRYTRWHETAYGVDYTITMATRTNGTRVWGKREDTIWPDVHNVQRIVPPSPAHIIDLCP